MFELNDETEWILGRPNFTCAAIAGVLRRLGRNIPRKAESEQAAVIHWMLCLWETHGVNWKAEGERLLKEAARNAPAQPVGEDS